MVHHGAVSVLSVRKDGLAGLWLNVLLTRAIV